MINGRFISGCVFHKKSRTKDALGVGKGFFNPSSTIWYYGSLHSRRSFDQGLMNEVSSEIVILLVTKMM